MSLLIRPATAKDQAAITRIVRAARLAPFDLAWPRFLVAEEEGCVVGVGQVRQYEDGSRELASLAVIPGCHGRGIGSQLVGALLAAHPGEMYLICRSELEPFYARFAFRRAGGEMLPRWLRRRLRLANLVVGLASRGAIGIIAMRRGA
ncbi:MAG: GNAT family N-acetyltransferase [Anaerolineales bacterium]|nr:GNAT family N-acetyltransferase [Anaerolineales bacterium]